MFPMASARRCIDAFREAFPTVALVLHAEALGAVAQMVLDGTCRVGISERSALPRRDPERPPLLGALVHVASPKHPLAHHEGYIPATCREHVQLVLTDRSRLTDGVDLGVLSDRTWRLADLGAKHEFLRAGFGWGGMPLHLVREDLESGRLVRITPAELTLDKNLALSAIYRSKDPPGPAGRWLIDRLASYNEEPVAEPAPASKRLRRAKPE